MRIRTFIKVINSGRIRSARIFDDESKDFWDVDKIIFSRKNKRFYFNDTEGKNQIEPIISTKDICEIVRAESDDDQYVFIIRLKDDKEYSVLFEMEDGYTPFLLKQQEIDNIIAVQEAIPQYLDRFKGQRVQICKAQYSPVYTVTDGAAETSMCTERCVIDNFDYTLETVSGFPLVKLLDKNNENFYNIAFGVRLIDGMNYDVDKGDYTRDESIIISADNGEFYLKSV